MKMLCKVCKYPFGIWKIGNWVILHYVSKSIVLWLSSSLSDAAIRNKLMCFPSLIKLDIKGFPFHFHFILNIVTHCVKQCAVRSKNKNKNRSEKC